MKKISKNTEKKKKPIFRLRRRRNWQISGNIAKSPENMI